jgi:Undecaprenyl-phosphate glucose phosphotransferase
MSPVLGGQMDNRDLVAESNDAHNAELIDPDAVASSGTRSAGNRQTAVPSADKSGLGFRHRSRVSPTEAQPRRGRAIARPVVCGLLRFYDWVLVFTTAIASVYLYRLINPHYRFSLALFLLVGLVAAFSANSLFNGLRLYEFERLSDLAWELKRILAGWAGIVLIGLSVGFLTKTSSNFSRIWLVAWFTMASFGLATGRLVVGNVIVRWSAGNRLRRQIAIVGCGSAARRLLEECRVSSGEEINIVGIFDDRQTRVPTELDGVGVLGSIDALITLVRRAIVDEVIIALPCSAAERINYFAKRLRGLPVDLRLWIDVSTRRLAIGEFEYRAGAVVAKLADRPLRHWNALSKRFEDIALSTIFLLIGAPVFLLLAIAIKLDSRGPVLFKQKRFGFNNEIVEVLKFRTMFVNRGDASGCAQTRRHDPRVTRFGRLLRQTSLDELPQLFNVMKGTMSIVGPRPHPLQMKAVNKLYHEAVGEYFARHRVRPGITGLAQVSGFRGEIDTMEKAQKRLDLDLHYIDHWSLSLDLKIILRTFWHLSDKNAY